MPKSKNEKSIWYVINTGVLEGNEKTPKIFSQMTEIRDKIKEVAEIMTQEFKNKFNFNDVLKMLDEIENEAIKGKREKQKK